MVKTDKDKDMAEQFRVAKKGSIVDLKGTLHRPGSLVDGELIGKAGIEDGLMNGYLVRERTEEDPNKFPPGTVLNPAVKSDGNLKKIEDAVVISTPEDNDAPPPAKQDKDKFRSRWRYDPANLKDKTLDQLNVLVQENDANVDPFKVKAEAIAYLSKDFVPEG